MNNDIKLDTKTKIEEYNKQVLVSLFPDYYNFLTEDTRKQEWSNDFFYYEIQSNEKTC